MNYYSHHIGDFDKATRHLTRIERSIYRDLLDVYYDAEHALPVDPDVIARRIVARSEEERHALTCVLAEFFELTDAGWTNKRAEEEIQGYARLRAKTAAAGRASGDARRSKSSPEPNGRSRHVEHGTNGCSTDVPPMLNPQSQSQSHNPITKEEPPTPKGALPAANVFEGLPQELDTPEFRAAWRRWLQFRRENRFKTLKPMSIESQWAALALHGPAIAITAIETSIKETWQGLFPKPDNHPKANVRDHRAEKRSREFPENIEIPDLV